MLGVIQIDQRLFKRKATDFDKSVILIYHFVVLYVEKNQNTHLTGFTLLPNISLKCSIRGNSYTVYLLSSLFSSIRRKWARWSDWARAWPRVRVHNYTTIRLILRICLYTCVCLQTKSQQTFSLFNQLRMKPTYEKIKINHILLNDIK